MMSTGATERLTRTYHAVAASVPAARHELTDFAKAAGASEEELQAIRIAVSEALTNVVLHAYGGSAGHVYVSAALAKDELWVLIGDDGSGLRAGGHSTGLGIGLALIAELSDSFSIVNRSSGGTEVRIRFALQRKPNPRKRHLASVRGSSASAVRPASSIFSTTR
jgi:anti-sigma regulatory factor (Ser/Thr protein kinase)